MAGKHWLLKEVVSWFDPQNKSHGRVEDVRINEPSALHAEATQQIEASRKLFTQDNRDQVRRKIAMAPIVFGRRQTFGPYAARCTVDEKGNVIVQIETAAADAPPIVPVMLLDERDRPLFAAHVALSQDNGLRRGAVSLGRSNALASVRWLAVAGLPSTGSQEREVSLNRLRWDEPLEINVPDQAEGKTRAYRVSFTRANDGKTRATVFLASVNAMQEFLLGLSVVVFDEHGRLLAAGLKDTSLRVEKSLAEVQHEIDLGHIGDVSKAQSFLMAVTAGDVISQHYGSTWMTFMRNSRSPLSTAQLLTAEDPMCWRMGVAQLGDSLEIRKEFFEGDRDRARLIERKATRADLLRPHGDRLLRIVQQSDDPALLTEAVRQLGHAGDSPRADAVRPLLTHAAPQVADAAAVALGMLGNNDGLDRLREILNRPRPSPDQARAHDRLDTDALIALATLGDDASIGLLGKTLLADLNALTVKTENDRQSVEGRSERAKRIISLLGLHDQPRAVPHLVAAVQYFDVHPDVAELFDQSPLAEALWRHEPEAREALAAQVAMGDYAYIRVLGKEPFYLPAVRKALLDPARPAGAAYEGIGYLWNLGTPEALSVLRDAYAQRVQRNDPRTHLHLCEALAALGDDRGMPDAYQALVEFFESGAAQGDKEQEYRRKWLDRGAKRVLDHVQRSSIVEFVGAKSDAATVAERQALVELLWRLPETPQSLVPVLQRWRNDTNTELAKQASSLLERGR